jgi:uncharacterized YigZ family protein
MDTYKTIASKSEGLFKDKGSKFIAYAFPVTMEDEIKELLSRVKKEHHSARHHCYAWRLGTGEPAFRMNDDGEPSSTAGKPILGQLIHFDVTNVLLVVVRYFGGTLLGTGGLINAYRSAAADALRNAEIITIIIEKKFRLKFSYNELNDVMLAVKQENLMIISTLFEIDCQVVFTVRKSEASRIHELFSKMYPVKIENL